MEQRRAGPLGIFGFMAWSIFYTAASKKRTYARNSPINSKISRVAPGYSQRDRRSILLPGHRIKPDVRKIAPDDRQLTSALSSRPPAVFPPRCRGAARRGAPAGRKRDGRMDEPLPPLLRSGAYFANFVSARMDARARSPSFSKRIHMRVHVYIYETHQPART